VNATKDTRRLSDFAAAATRNETMANDEEEIRRLVSTWMAASRAGDVETALSLMTDDVVFLVAGQPVMRKADFAGAARAQSGPDAPRIDGSSEIQEIKIFGDWAFMWTRLNVIATPAGTARPVRRAGHTLTVLERQNGKWRIARDANLLAPVGRDSGRLEPSGGDSMTRAPYHPSGRPIPGEYASYAQADIDRVEGSDAVAVLEALAGRTLAFLKFETDWPACGMRRASGRSRTSSDTWSTTNESSAIELSALREARACPCRDSTRKRTRRTARRSSARGESSCRTTGRFDRRPWPCSGGSRPPDGAGSAR
jgi:uncharacterized protein (TIGR02246 family)